MVLEITSLEYSLRTDDRESGPRHAVNISIMLCDYVL
jgi:hypothetical protein